nr:hypothetical protein [Oligoflexales bacterium]
EQLVRFKDKDIARKGLLKSINHNFIELQKKAAETLSNLVLQADDISILQTIMQSSTLSIDVLSTLGLAAEMIFTTDSFNLIYENLNQSDEKLRIEYLDRLQRMFDKSKELVSNTTAAIILDKLKSTYKEVRTFSVFLSPLQPSLVMTAAVIGRIKDEEINIRDFSFKYLMEVDLKYLDFSLNELLKKLILDGEVSIEDRIKVISVLKRMPRNGTIVDFAIENIDHPISEIQNKLLELVHFHKIDNVQCAPIKTQLLKKYVHPIRIELLEMLAEVIHFQCLDEKIDLLLLDNDAERNFVLEMTENDFPLIKEDPKTPSSNFKAIVTKNLMVVIRNSPHLYIREKIFSFMQTISPMITHKTLAELLNLPESEKEKIKSGPPKFDENGKRISDNPAFLNLYPTPDICENVFRILIENPISIPKDKLPIDEENKYIDGYFKALSENFQNSNCLGGEEFVLNYFYSNNSYYTTKYLIYRIKYMEEGVELENVLEILASRSLDEEVYMTEIGVLLDTDNKPFVKRLGLDLLKLAPEDAKSTTMLISKFYKEKDSNLRSEQIQLLRDRVLLIDKSMHVTLVNAVEQSKFQDAQILATQLLATQKNIDPNQIVKLKGLLDKLKDEIVVEAIQDALVQIYKNHPNL